MDSSTHEVRLSYWKDIIEQCHARPDGMTAKMWLENNDISVKSYYYWQRKLRNNAYDQMKGSDVPAVQKSSQVAFAEIPVTLSNSNDEISSSIIQPVAVIKTPAATIALSNEISDRILSRILQEVSHA